MLPEGQVLLNLSNEAHRWIRLHVHGGQDCYDNKKPRGGASWVYTFNDSVLSMRK